MRPPKVYIPNKGGHDYSDAERFGPLVFLTEGKIKRYSVNTLYREIADGMSDAIPEDFILVSSLNILNSICSAIMSRQFGRVNFLLFCNGEYIERNLMIDALLPEIKGEDIRM